MPGVDLRLDAVARLEQRRVAATDLRLADAIRDKLPIAGDLSSPDESRKGGSILYGMWEASRRNDHDTDHVILFTDAAVFAMGIPNIIGLYFFAPEIKRDVKAYIAALKSPS